MKKSLKQMLTLVLAAGLLVSQPAMQIDAEGSAGNPSYEFDFNGTGAPWKTNAPGGSISTNTDEGYAILNGIDAGRGTALNLYFSDIGANYDEYAFDIRMKFNRVGKDSLLVFYTETHRIQLYFYADRIEYRNESGSTTKVPFPEGFQLIEDPETGGGNDWFTLRAVSQKVGEDYVVTLYLNGEELVQYNAHKWSSGNAWVNRVELSAGWKTGEIEPQLLLDYFHVRDLTPVEAGERSLVYADAFDTLYNEDDSPLWTITNPNGVEVKQTTDQEQVISTLHFKGDSGASVTKKGLAVPENFVFSFRSKIDSYAKSQIVMVHTGEARMQIYLEENQFTVRNAEGKVSAFAYPLGNDFHTWEIVAYQNLVTVYIDGNYVVSCTWHTVSGEPVIQFSTECDGNEADWYIDWCKLEKSTGTLCIATPYFSDLTIEDTLSGGQTVTGKVDSVLNTSDYDADYNAILASYGADGKLLGVEFTDQTIAAKSAASLEQSFTVPDGQIAEIALYIWKSADTLIPYAKPAYFPEEIANCTLR